MLRASSHPTNFIKIENAQRVIRYTGHIARKNTDSLDRLIRTEKVEGKRLRQEF